MKYLLLLLAVLLGIPAAWASETGTALKNDSLRAEPYGDAKAVGSLNRGDKVDILARQGAWLQVKAGKTTGWVRLLSVRRGTATGSNEAAGVLALASGRSGTGQVVSTTGVRGLGEEELKSAQFNDADIRMLDASAVTADDARQFAAAGGLTARRLDYLPAPKGGAQ